MFPFPVTPTTYDFGAVVIRLQADAHTLANLRTRKPRAEISAFMGRASHEAFYRTAKTLLGDEPTALIHDTSAVMPFTTSDLFRPHLDLPFRGRVTVGTEVWLRWTGLSTGVMGMLNQLPGTLDTLELDRARWQVMRVEQHDPLWGGGRHAAVLIQHSEQLPPPRWIAVDFLTPTLFKSRGVEAYDIPEPRLVFGESLVHRWQIYSAQTAIPAGYRDFLSTHVHLVRNRTHKISVMMKTAQVGLQGRAIYAVDADADPSCARLLRTMATYARYAAVGRKTTMGFGMVYTRTV
jgi:CRISPR-associated endoribonuclease Cas6